MPKGQSHLSPSLRPSLQVILDYVKLAIKMNHHTFLASFSFWWLSPSLWPQDSRTNISSLFSVFVSSVAWSQEMYVIQTCTLWSANTKGSQQRVHFITVGRVSRSSPGHIMTARKQREGLPALDWVCGTLSSRHDATIALLNSRQL